MGSSVRQIAVWQCALSTAPSRVQLCGSITSTFLFSPLTHMKNFLKLRRKKSPQPPLRPASPGNPADVAVGLPGPGFPTGLDPVSEGEHFRRHDFCRLPDLTLEQFERGGVSPQLAFLDRADEDQEHPASKTSTSVVAIDDTGCRDKPAGEYP